jgi:hypothetical protein
MLIVGVITGGKSARVQKFRFDAKSLCSGCSSHKRLWSYPNVSEFRNENWFYDGIIIINHAFSMSLRQYKKAIQWINNKQLFSKNLIQLYALYRAIKLTFTSSSDVWNQSTIQLVIFRQQMVLLLAYDNPKKRLSSNQHQGSQ